MKTTNCPECGKPVGDHALQGLCPECMLKVGLGSQPPGTQPLNPADGNPPRFVPPDPARLAAAFPQLDLLELVGVGGMGAVYKARQRNLDRTVALKILPPDTGQGTAFAERFSREARALARLNHPNIVTVHDFGQAGGFYYFLMEFIDGANLRHLLSDQKLPPETALAIVPQICEALQYAHTQGVVHRDIKPENILLDKAGRVKIADFGLAKLTGTATSISRLTQPREVMGTPHYMAPEQVEHPADVDHRADIFSLGVVFYEMLTGELPLGKFQPPSHRVQVDVRLDEIVLHALEKEPARRYQQAGQVKTDVETVVGHPEAGTRSPSSRQGSGEDAGMNPPLSGPRWRDLWPWDAPCLALFLAVPGAVAGILVLLFLSRWGWQALWLLALELVGLGFAATYGWIGSRLRKLKAGLPASQSEVAEGLAVRRHVQSPALIVLHADRLGIVPVVTSPWEVRLQDVSSIAEVRWFNGTRLWWKKGYVLRTADGQQYGVAIPESYARRWCGRLGLPALEPPRQVSPVQPSRSGAAAGGLVAFLIVLVVAATVTAWMPRTYRGVARVETAQKQGLFDPYWLQQEYAVITSADLLNRVALSLGLAQRPHYDSGKATEDEVRQLMRARLVLRQIRGTALTEIHYYAPSRQEAANAANGIAEAYCQALGSAGARMVDRADPPLGPVRPNVGLNLAVGALLGLVVGYARYRQLRAGLRLGRAGSAILIVGLVGLAVAWVTRSVREANREYAQLRPVDAPRLVSTWREVDLTPSNHNGDEFHFLDLGATRLSQAPWPVGLTPDTSSLAHDDALDGWLRTNHADLFIRFSTRPAGPKGAPVISVLVGGVSVVCPPGVGRALRGVDDPRLPGLIQRAMQPLWAKTGVIAVWTVGQGELPYSRVCVTESREAYLLHFGNLPGGNGIRIKYAQLSTPAIAAPATAAGVAGSPASRQPVSGQLIITPGTHLLPGTTLHSVAVATNAQGALSATFFSHNGSSRPEVALQPGWFIYPEGPDRVWLCPGDATLARFEFHPDLEMIRGVDADPSLAAQIPEVLLPHLPAAVRNRLPGQAADVREARAKLAELMVNYTQEHPEARAMRRRIEELERLSREEPNLPADLREAKARLAELLVSYADEHPLVKQAQARIKALTDSASQTKP